MAVTTRELLAHAAGERDVAGEATRRMTVSRAYYAAYHQCLIWSGRLPVPAKKVPPTSGVHQTLIDQLRKPPAGTASKVAIRAHSLAKRLSRLKGRRVRADYQLAKEVSPEDVRKQLSEARELFAYCDGQILGRR